MFFITQITVIQWHPESQFDQYNDETIFVNFDNQLFYNQLWLLQFNKSMVIQVNETMMRVLMKAYCLLWDYQQILLEIHLRINTNNYIVQQIFYFKEYIFSSFRNIIILFTYLIRQFHFHIILIEKSRIISND